MGKGLAGTGEMAGESKECSHILWVGYASLLFTDAINSLYYFGCTKELALLNIWDMGAKSISRD